MRKKKNKKKLSVFICVFLWPVFCGLDVLVQREMESGRSPLVSIARAAAGTRKQRTETAAGFKGNQGGPQ
jgi:hypothetical protein